MEPICEHRQVTDESTSELTNQIECLPADRAAPVPELRRGSCLGRYRLDSVLGRGGSSTVYLAHAEGRFGYAQSVALKVVPCKRQSTNGLVREVFLQSQLNHPAVVQVYDLGIDSGHIYCAMEYVRGPNLKSLIRRSGAMPLSAVVDAGIQLCDVLGYLHGTSRVSNGQSIVHADIKPANLFLNRFGQLRISDFGISVHRASNGDSGCSMGTAAYMAPEQVRGKPLDGRTDLFSMGAVLYEMATGERFFSKKSVKELLVERISVSPWSSNALKRRWRIGNAGLLKPILQGCLQIDPGRRYQTAEDAGKALKRLRRRLGTGPDAREWVMIQEQRMAS